MRCWHRSSSQSWLHDIGQATGGEQFVVIGNPATFKAEHSEAEPKLVFLKPITAQPSEGNALITTKLGQEITLHLMSGGKAGQCAGGFLVKYRRQQSFLVDSSDRQSFLIAETYPTLPAGRIQRSSRSSRKTGSDYTRTREAEELVHARVGSLQRKMFRVRVCSQLRQTQASPVSKNYAN
jgi:hypothetical protein